MNRPTNKQWLPITLPKRLLAVFLLLLQIFLYAYFIFSSGAFSTATTVVLWVVGVVAALCVVTRKGESAYKLTWIFFILSLPLFGAFMYLMLMGNTSGLRFKRRVRESEAHAWPYLKPEEETEPMTALDERKELRYLSSHVGFPVCGQTDAAFFPSGEAMFAALKEMLMRAKQYIFLEFFIISEGEMWGEILDILKQKAAEGVTVRLLYDDVGSFLLLPHRYPKMLEKYGIEAKVFNPFVPVLKSEQNNRDHRKIVVVDGIHAITGGVNLADEYINRIEKHGHWNDAAVRVSGRAAWSLAVFFLQMWEVCSKKREELLDFYPKAGFPRFDFCEGAVVPYVDDPLDNEAVGEQVYLQMIGTAREYVYITTPYLIIDDKMVTALTSAAKSGVDVCIVVPHHWDKRVVHATTRTYYWELIASGVRVYEYTPGFIHAKTVVSDDKVATVGTVNFDYRSLYLHFECGVFFYDHKTIWDVKSNFLRILEVSEEIRCQRARVPFLSRLWESFLRLLSPIM